MTKYHPQLLLVRLVKHFIVITMLNFSLKNPSNFELVQLQMADRRQKVKGTTNQCIINNKDSLEDTKKFVTSQSDMYGLSSIKSKRKSLQIKDASAKSPECKTYIKVGQMSSEPKRVIPFVIEWIPNLLPRMGVGELTVRFEFGHQRNGQVDS